MDAFIRQLKRYRAENGLSQSELGTRLGVHYMTITRWELGICKPRLPQMHRIQKFFEENDVFFDPLFPIVDEVTAMKVKLDEILEKLKYLTS